MTGAVSTAVPAADYNSIQSTISSVMGAASLGSTFGYGQTLISAPVVFGKPIKAADWQNLYTDISRAYTHQTGSAPSGAVLPVIAGGATWNAAATSLYASVANTCSTNRLVINVANVTNTTPVANTTITRATAWGSSASAAIACVASFTWASEASASAFFNTGGYVYMTLAHPNTSTTQNTAWNSFLSAFGTFTFSGTSIGKGGGNGAITSIAYSAYTAGGTTVLNTAQTTANYTANTIAVVVKKITNGMSVTVTLTDGHTNAFSDAVALGTNAAFGWVRATDSNNLPTLPVAPTFTKTTNF